MPSFSINQILRFFVFFVVILYGTSTKASTAPEPIPDPGGSPWFHESPSNQRQIDFYFFWSKTCPHCQKARPFVNTLEKQHRWISVHSLEITENRDHALLYVRLARLLDREAKGVPAFLFCKTMYLGFDKPETTGKVLLDQLNSCRQKSNEGIPVTSPKSEKSFSIPGLDGFKTSDYSLPTLTVLIAGMDAFNPCAFFVLLFLLSLLVHAENRWRMAFIGSVFVFFSGLIYFTFMAGWLNLFL